MKRLELAFYCVRTSSCKHKLCITGGETCLFLKAEWETKLKEAIYAKNATPNHSPAAAKPQELQNTHVAESKKKQESKFDEEKAFRDTTAEGALPGVTVEDLKRGKKDRDKRHRTAVVETDVEADSEFDFEEEAEFRHGRSSTAHEGSIRIR